jgi:beta-galactosidase
MNTKIHDSFLIGANYWSRKHGPAMWREWCPEEIDQELKELHDCGMNSVRIFLTWNDFQPIKEYYKGSNADKIPIKVCLRHDENQTIENNPYLMNLEMVDKFDQFLQLSEKYKIKVIPSLLTGFMGGVLFDVDFRNGRSIYTDPTMLYYQELYFSFFAERYADNETILAWQFGNEMTCYEKLNIPAEQRLWMNTLVNAIRKHDTKHPITPGNEGQVSNSKYSADGCWHHHITLEMCDVTTVHTYPVFMPETRGDTLSLKSTYCAPWRTRLAASCYPNPVLTEEISTVGTSYMSDATSAKWTRSTLFSLLGNGDSGMLWWTGSDMECHEKMPYCFASTNASEHGGIALMDTKGKAKLQADEYKKFADLMSKIDFKKLNKKAAKAAIVYSAGTGLNDLQKRKISLTSFILCKMAGLEVDIINSEEDFEPYQLLICPSYGGLAPVFYKDQRKIDDFVKQGGTLYLSMEDGCWERFETLFGVKINEKLENTRTLAVQFTDDIPDMSIQPDWKTDITLDNAQCVANIANGSPAITVNQYGKGKAFLSLYNMEEYLADFSSDDFAKNNFWKFYKHLKETAGINNSISNNNPFIEISDCDKYVVLINHSKELVEDSFDVLTAIKKIKNIADGSIIKILNNKFKASIPPFDGRILEIG